MNRNIVSIYPLRKRLIAPPNTPFRDIYTDIVDAYVDLDLVEFEFPFWYPDDTHVILRPGWQLRIEDEIYEEARIMELQI